MPTNAPAGRSVPPRRGAGVLTLLAVLAFVALGAFLLLRRDMGQSVQAPPPATPPPTTAPATLPPVTEAAAMAPSPEPPASPAASPAVEPAAATPIGPGPKRRPRPGTPAGTQVADAGIGAPAAPGNLPAPPPLSGRRFVLGTTSVESLKKVGGDLKGFDAAGVGVKRAPEVNGRVELEMTPREMRPGIDYTVRVFLANDGDRDIPVQEVKITTVENGKTTARNVTPGARMVKPKHRALLHETEGVWREAARTWTMEVTVTSGREDVYRNRLSWQ